MEYPFKKSSKPEVEPEPELEVVPEPEPEQPFSGPGKPIPGAKPVYTDATCLHQDWWSYHTKE